MRQESGTFWKGLQHYRASLAAARTAPGPVSGLSALPAGFPKGMKSRGSILILDLLTGGRVCFCPDCVVRHVLFLVAEGYYNVFSESYKLAAFK